MTSSEYFSNIEPWLYKTVPFSDTWLSESFARDNETLTLALQNSISSDNSSHSPIFSPGLSANSGSSEPPPPPNQQKRSSIPVSAKPTKRRSRASKKATTTFINATPANFRQMVQQVTGVFIPEEYPMRPEPMRAGGRVQGGCIPTLDTSTFLLEKQLQLQQQQTCWDTSAAVATSVPSAPVPLDGESGSGFDFDSFFGRFPTLESFGN